MNVVAIGGGTGLSTLLRGLKKKVGEDIGKLQAIVTVADSGGSTGKLREIYNIPAPGDIRNCLVALSEQEEVLKDLFQYRFKGQGLDGHALGNLFITALTDITGSFMDAIRLASEILKTKGEIIPSTIENIHLCAKFSDGNIVEGEEKITEYGKEHTETKIEEIWIEPKNAKPTIDTLAAIESADVIIFGPGSLYTSIIPNLLIEDIREAVKSSGALKIFVVNVMTQPGETNKLTAKAHIDTFIEHTGVDNINVAVVNTKMPSSELLNRYLEKNQEPVIPDVASIARSGIEVFAEDLIGEKEDFIRHDEEKLANILIRIIKGR